MDQLDELTTTATRMGNRRMGRRGLLRTFALGGAGIATAALIGCSDDEPEDDDAMMAESMTPTEGAMADGSMTATAMAGSVRGSSARCAPTGRCRLSWPRSSR